MTQNGKIRVGIVGVGNNASALVQGVYRQAQDTFEDEQSADSGIRFPLLCGYSVADVEFTSAFDVDCRKIGRDLGQAIFSEPNCYPRLMDPPRTSVVVTEAPVLDGVPPFLAEMVQVRPNGPAHTNGDDVMRLATIVRETRTEALINFLPSGSDQATQLFARVAAEGGAAYINCTPTPAVHSPEIVELFRHARLPLLGDDLESQFGSSLLHRTLLSVLEERGLNITHSYQVNLGGNTDFKNLSHRSDAKKRSKMKAISTCSGTAAVDILPSGGFVRGLGDTKVGYIVIEGRGWNGTPVSIDLKLRVQDSSNAAGVTIDLVRLARGALDRKLVGEVPFSYYFKNPPGPKLNTPEAIAVIERFDRGEPM